MILVTIGTSEPFDRLLRALPSGANGEELFVQRGPSNYCPPRAICVDYWPYQTLVEYVRRARVVLTHAGVGSILVAMENGRKPVVVPRLAKFGEAVDDHQLELGRRLHELGLVKLVEDVARLPSILTEDSEPVRAAGHSSPLASELRAYIAARVVQGQPQRG